MRTLLSVLAAVGVLAVSACGDDGETDGQPSEQTADERESDGTPESAQPEKPSSPEQSAREALGDDVSSDLAVGDSSVRSVEVFGKLLNVTLSTPEGGFDGPSADDTDALASAAFAKAYEDAAWDGPAFVEFRGGLVDSATGRDAPNARTASYRVERGSAKDIDWSDEEALFSIDWGIYRIFCHPALKGC